MRDRTRALAFVALALTWPAAGSAIESSPLAAQVSQCAAVSAVPVIPPGQERDFGSSSPEQLMQGGLAAHGRGDLRGAAAAWLAAGQGSAQAGDAAGEAEALLRAAQARSALGFVAESVALLERASTLAEAAGDVRRQAAIKGALAQSYLETGDSSQAGAMLREALPRAREAGAAGLEARLLLTQGDLRAAAGDAAGAAAAYQESETLAARSTDDALAAQASARAARALLDAGRRSEAVAALDGAAERARALPDSDAKAQMQIHLGRTSETLGDATKAARAQRDALGTAQRVGAHRSSSYALGYLAALYETSGRRDEAITLTRRAIAEAQRAEAPEALYRWHWQEARLLAEAGDAAGALDAYRRAVTSVEALRSGRAATGIDFSSGVEPVYFGLVDLLLRQAAAAPGPARRTELLAEARNHLESLKSAELREHFHDPCLAVTQTRQAGAIPGAVIVYPVVLPDRIEMIVSRPDGLSSVVSDVTAERLEQEIRTFRLELQRRTTRRYRLHAAQLYDWLIRPLEAEIGQREVDALVFVPGGALRTIPMAALYDSAAKQFLVEKYPLAVIPALTLTDPRPIDHENVRALLAGLTESVQGYPALANVEPELTALGEILAGKQLVNGDFVASRVQQSLADESVGIVHIASHGEFRAESSESFVLTYDGRIAMSDLAVLVERTRFRDQPIELLTLSACQTAAGDDEAALGLAGVAVRSGARSAIATLWSVNDAAAADLIAEFYRQLAQPDVSRAQALQRAQISLLESRPYRHPGYWAPFLLISNWM